MFQKTSPDRSPDQRIVEAAVRLFNMQGVHTTGVDQIIEEASVAKKTFYKYFPSKNNLIAEYFGVKDQIWFSLLKKHTLETDKCPLEKALGLFNALKEWFSESNFHGCPFIRGLADFGEEADDPVLKQCIADHFAKTFELVALLLKPVNPKNYLVLVPQIMSLIAGATVLAHATKDPGVADINKEMARQLLVRS